MELTDAEARALARLPEAIREGFLARVAERGWNGDDDGVLHDYDTVTVVVAIPGIDRGIAPLVAAMNRLNGVRTVASCAGRTHSHYETRAHVMWHSLGFVSPSVDDWLRSAATVAGVAIDIVLGGDELWLQPEDVRAVARALNDAIDASEG